MLSTGLTLCSQKAVVDLILLPFKSTRRAWKISGTRKKPPGSIVQVRNQSKMQNKNPTSTIVTVILLHKLPGLFSAVALGVAKPREFPAAKTRTECRYREQGKILRLRNPRSPR